MDINENIKTLCKARGISFADLAARLNITRQTLYRQSTGAAQLSTVERIADALNVPAFVLIHPAPAAALLQIRTGQVPGPAEDRTSQGDTIQAARLLCPFCGRPVTIQITPAEGVKPNAAPVVSSFDPDQDSSSTKRQEEGRPEEMKLF